MEGFWNAVDHCRLVDLGFSRNKFMWFTTKGGGIKVRLDRALGNQEWMDLFPRFKVQHLNKSLLNQIPVLHNWSRRTPIRGKKKFRYEEVWHMHEGCNEVVQDGWNHTVEGSPMFQVTEKIKMMRMKLSN